MFQPIFSRNFFADQFKPFSLASLKEQLGNIGDDRLISWNGFTIEIEVKEGELRFGKALIGCHYGEILGTVSDDLEPVDVYIAAGFDPNNPEKNSPHIYRIAQLTEDGHFDEWKFGIGFWSIDEFISVYCQNVNPRRYGQAYVSSFEELSKYACLQVIDKSGYLVVESLESQGLAKKVISRIAPGRGQKVSGNDRVYEDYPVLIQAKKKIKEQEQGVPTINPYRHSEESINRNEPVSLWTETYIDEDEAIYALDSFVQTPKGIDYAGRCFRGEYVPRSWEVDGNCTRGTKGRCSITTLDRVVWLDPKEGDKPGFGSSACVVKIVEALEDCQCQCHKPNSQLKECYCNLDDSNSLKQLLQLLLNNSTNSDLINAPGNSLGESNKGENKKMKFETFLKKMFSTGTPWAEVEKMLTDEMGATPEDVSAAMKWWLLTADSQRSSSTPDDSWVDQAMEVNADGTPKNVEKYTEALAKFPAKAKEAMAKKVKEAKGTDPNANPNANKKDPLVEQLIEQQKATQAKLDEVTAKLNNPILPPNITQLDESIEKSKQVDGAISKLQTQLSERQVVAGHNLSDTNKYPLARIVKLSESMSKTMKENNYVLEDVQVLLKDKLNEIAANPKEEQLAESIKGGYSYNSRSNPTDDHKLEGYLKEQYERTDLYLETTSEGRERLAMRESLGKINKSKAEKASKTCIERSKGTLIESIKYQEDLKEGRTGNWQNIAEQALKEKLCTLKESITQLDASVLGAQALVGPNAVRRVYEETPHLQWMASLGPEFNVAYTPEDPRFGLEFRFPLDDFKDPNVYLPKIKNPGKGVFPGSSMVRDFDSVYADQFGTEYEYEEGQLDGLRKNPNNIDIRAEMEAFISGYFNRVVSRFCGDEMDNQARRHLAKKVTEESPSADNYVGGNIIYVNGKKLVYDEAVVAIIRLLAGQDNSLTGEDVQGRIIVRATPRTFLKSNGKADTSRIDHNAIVTKPNGDPAVLGRLVQDGKKVLPNFEGETPDGAFDENHGLFLVLNDNNTTGFTAANVDDAKFTYWYNVDNVIRISLALNSGDGRTPAQVYGDGIRAAMKRAAFVQDTRKLAPRLAICTAQIGRGVVAASDEYQNYYSKAGSTLNPKYADEMDMGVLGLLRFLAHNGHNPLGNAGILLTREFTSGFAFAQQITFGELTRVTVGKGVDERNRSTQAMSQTIQARMATHSPRLIAKAEEDTDVPIEYVNEPTTIVAIDDIEEGSGLST